MAICGARSGDRICTNAPDHVGGHYWEPYETYRRRRENDYTPQVGDVIELTGSPFDPSLFGEQAVITNVREHGGFVVTLTSRRHPSGNAITQQANAHNVGSGFRVIVEQERQPTVSAGQDSDVIERHVEGDRPQIGDVVKHRLTEQAGVVLARRPRRFSDTVLLGVGLLPGTPQGGSSRFSRDEALRIIRGVDGYEFNERDAQREVDRRGIEVFSFWHSEDVERMRIRERPAEDGDADREGEGYVPHVGDIIEMTSWPFSRRLWGQRAVVINTQPGTDGFAVRVLSDPDTPQSGAGSMGLRVVSTVPRDEPAAEPVDEALERLRSLRMFDTIRDGRGRLGLIIRAAVDPRTLEPKPGTDGRTAAYYDVESGTWDGLGTTSEYEIVHRVNEAGWCAVRQEYLDELVAYLNITNGGYDRDT